MKVAGYGDVGGVEATSDTDAEVQRRFHFLDWLRAAMIGCVVYAHVARMGLLDGIYGEVQLDNHTYIGEDPKTLGTRWVSLIRQWCLPVLFWVSGAAAGCAYRGFFKGFVKMLVFTMVGIGLNAALWYLGPRDTHCDPGTFHHSVSCKGVLFSFTICPWSGDVFPIIFQMWFTLMLAILMVLNSPLFSILSGRTARPHLAVVQWAMSSILYISLTWYAGFLVPYPVLLVGFLLLYEAAFLVIALLTVPRWRPRWLPLRVLHYLAAVIVVQQFAATPVVNSMNTISTAFVLYILVGFNKFYQLGFVMMRARSGRPEDDAKPLVSGVWPLMPVLLAVLAPSSNWFMAGNLTYPYFPRLEDRWLYVCGAVVLIFMLDRCDRHLPVMPLPRALGEGALMLYLLHPTIMTLIVAVLPTSWRLVPLIWLATISVAAVFAVARQAVICRHPSRKGSKDLASSDEEFLSEE